MSNISSFQSPHGVTSLLYYLLSLDTDVTLLPRHRALFNGVVLRAIK